MTGLILDSASIEDIKELAIRAEGSNFHSVWSTELYRTSFQQLAAVSSVTNRIKLGSAVALAFTRSPLITSLTALDLDEMSDGRFILGLGTGAKNTNERYHGIKYGKPVKRIEECVEIIRHYISSSHMDTEHRYSGEYYDINTRGFKRAFKPVRDKIPLYMAGIGNNMARSSAKIADGYLGHVVCHKSYLKDSIIPAINEGLEEADKQRSDFTVSSIITCAVANKPREAEKAKKAAKATIGFYAVVKTYRRPFEMAGFSDQTRRIRDAYFNKDIKGMIENVSDDMVENFAVIGNEDQCREKIDGYRKIIDLPILSVPHYFIDYEDVKKYQYELLRVFGN